jgi:diguanylate cyclase (GGDEF)-like protein
MNQTHRASGIFTVLSAVIALAAGIGVWYVLAEMTPTRTVIVIPVSALVIAIVLLLMLHESEQAGLQTGATSAEMDVFTRLPSYTVAYQLLQREFAAAERGRALSVVLFSLDNLPRLAATRGANEAGRMLLAVGTIFRRSTRGMNIVSRMDDGHTFVAILGTVDESGARKYAGKVARDLSNLRVGGKPLEVRVGVRGFDPDMQSADELLARAHDALVQYLSVEAASA